LGLPLLFYDENAGFLAKMGAGHSYRASFISQAGPQALTDNQFIASPLTYCE
jgi:hypothetical protein